jgi:hypothetical protein
MSNTIKQTQALHKTILTDFTNTLKDAFTFQQTLTGIDCQIEIIEEEYEKALSQMLELTKITKTKKNKDPNYQPVKTTTGWKEYKTAFCPTITEITHPGIKGQNQKWTIIGQWWGEFAKPFIMDSNNVRVPNPNYDAVKHKVWLDKAMVINEANKNAAKAFQENDADMTAQPSDAEDDADDDADDSDCVAEVVVKQTKAKKEKVVKAKKEKVVKAKKEKVVKAKKQDEAIETEEIEAIEIETEDLPDMDNLQEEELDN